MREVTLQYFEGCPNWKVAARNLDALVDEGIAVAVSHEVIQTDEDAIARRFRGSPTVLVEGVDPFPTDDAPVGLTCRVYETESGTRGSPSIDQLRAALEPLPSD